ncbi:MAG: RNA polymerase factor sigma-54 [Gammaproteobacteria bacterium]|nr:RNA polymerase factor sigma-54 [Gammaproteobacteria bacterium]|tara:strand:- start:12088 stop:13482 length:1395 start_codon:yes stop_codon:yes gene_type:complete
MLKPSLQLKHGQSLAMTPQLQQAIRLLQLPVLDLSAQLQKALEENIMLEIDDLPDISGTNDLPQNKTENIKTDESWQSGSSDQNSDNNWDLQDRFNIDFADESNETLQEHLNWQLEIEKFTAREVLIGEALVDSFNDDGYLTDSIQEIIESLDEEPPITLGEAEKILFKIQRLDPVGVGARSLSECIIRQVEQLNKKTPGRNLALKIASDYLDLVADQDYRELRRNLSISEDHLNEALALIRGCNPKPGLTVNSVAAQYVIPDVFVKKIDNQWQVEISPSGIPRLSVNQKYAQILRGNNEHEALKTQLQEARWLVRSLEIRNDTLMQVATSIVSRQVKFLELGDEEMKPMILQDIANEIGMHESTISRVTSNKYMHTPRGVFKFKFFFSSHISSNDGKDHSSTSVRAKIKKLIAAEDPKKPLSDNKIKNLLESEGITVARRTVAKYREAMNISSSSDRKIRVKN